MKRHCHGCQFAFYVSCSAIYNALVSPIKCILNADRTTWRISTSWLWVFMAFINLSFQAFEETPCWWCLSLLNINWIWIFNASVATHLCCDSGQKEKIQMSFYSRCSHKVSVWELKWKAKLLTAWMVGMAIQVAIRIVPIKVEAWERRVHPHHKGFGFEEKCWRFFMFFFMFCWWLFVS